MAGTKTRITYVKGSVIFALIWDYDKVKIWYPKDEVFETYGTNNRTAADYAIYLTESADNFYIEPLTYYFFTWPLEMKAGIYELFIKLQSGDSPANDDVVIGGPVKRNWNGNELYEYEPETNAVFICNLALAKLGGSEGSNLITTLDPDTLADDNPIKPTVESLSLLYTPARKEVLKRIKPQECIYYADLGDESSFSGEMAEWKYVFDLPEDYLLFLRQTDELYHKMDYPHEIKQGKLFTNYYSNEDGDSAYIEYVKNENDASVFSSEVVDAIATKIAAEAATAVLKGEWAWRRRQELLEEYEKLILPNSMGINREQQHQEEYEDYHYSWLGDRN